MTMLTSLKALLFPTVAPGGAQAMTLPAEGSVDFAQFLGAAQADKPASPPAADDVAAFAARTSATLVGQEYSHGGDKAMAPAGPAMPAPLVEGDAGAQPALEPMPGQGAVPAPIEAAPTASPATAQPSRVPDADGADPEVLKRPHASTDVPEGSPAVVRLPMPGQDESPAVALGRLGPSLAGPGEDVADPLQPVAHRDGPSPSPAIAAPADMGPSEPPVANLTQEGQAMAVASATPEAAMLAPMDDSVAKPVVPNEAERAETPVVPAEGGEDEQAVQPDAPKAKTRADRAEDAPISVSALAMPIPVPVSPAPVADSAPSPVAAAPVAPATSRSQPAMPSHPSPPQPDAAPVDAGVPNIATTMSPKSAGLPPQPIAAPIDPAVPMADHPVASDHAPVASSTVPVENRAVPAPPTATPSAEPQAAEISAPVDAGARSVAPADATYPPSPVPQPAKATHAVQPAPLAGVAPQIRPSVSAGAEALVTDPKLPVDQPHPAVAQTPNRSEPVTAAPTARAPVGHATAASAFDPAMAAPPMPVAREGADERAIPDTSAAPAVGSAMPRPAMMAASADGPAAPSVATRTPPSDIPPAEAPPAPALHAAGSGAAVARSAAPSVSAPATPAEASTLSAAREPPPVVAPREIVSPPLPAEPATPASAGRGAVVTGFPTTPAMAAQTAADQPAAAQDDAVVTPPDMVSDVARPMVQRVRAEAVSLLQLVRDQMIGRAPQVAEPRGDSAAAPMTDAPSATPAAAPVPASAATAPLLTPAPQATAQIAPLATPVSDLSASLGAQMVDMGVSGQWIDGLARDIAGLSANGAQGRFQINADQLGPVQVDIRQGADGVAVSLTVASEAAELALRQDSDQLKRDPAFAAGRIHDVRVERSAHVTEPARTDTASNQNGSQSDLQQQPSSGQWQAQGQGSGQSQMQGRQGRENIAHLHKNGGEPVVMDSEEAGNSARDTVRARYA